MRSEGREEQPHGTPGNGHPGGRAVQRPGGMDALPCLRNIKKDGIGDSNEVGREG